MKVLLINGSPKPKGCTARALREVAETLQKEGIETEILQVGSKPVRGCIACGTCEKNGKCVFDDIVNEAAKKFEECDGLIVGSPVYYGSANGNLVSFLDRLFYSTSFDKKMKVGASVVSCMEGKRIKEDCTKTTWTLDNDYFKGTLTGTCVEDEEEVYCDFACKPEEESQHRAVCDEDNWLYGYRCVKLQTGTYYWKYYQEYCSHGCNGTHDGCVRLHEDEGKPCDDSYQSK